MFVLDHLLLFCAKGAPEADALVHLGLTEGPSNTHPGQGTANRRFFFHDAYLELLWVDDEIKARSETVRQTQLWERWAGRLTDACPFGVVLRPGSSDGLAPPFSVWAYRPTYLPAGLTIDVADNVALAEPAIFYLGFAGAPRGTHDAARRHRLGLERITGVTIDTPVSGSCSDPVQWLKRSGIMSLRSAERWLMRVTFDGQRSGASTDLRPVLPLILEY
jgi:hypothetical protein